jgi:Spy/CpxP family protein refolding chaperone
VTRTKGLALAMYLGALLAGAAIALAADRVYTRGGRGPEGRPTRAGFYDQLKLTPAQRDSATAYMDARDKKFKALMEQWKTQLEPLRAAQDSIDAEWRQRLTQLLTSEQKAIYDQMQAERRGRGGRGGQGR